MRSVVNDRLLKVEKDLDVLRKIFGRHDEQQQKNKRQMLNKGAAFFQNMCSFDPKELKEALNDEIKSVEAQIALAKAGSMDRQREKLAELLLEVDDGKIGELVTKKHAKFEADIRAKLKAELLKEIEAE